MSWSLVHVGLYVLMIYAGVYTLTWVAAEAFHDSKYRFQRRILRTAMRSRDVKDNATRRRDGGTEVRH